MKLTRFEGIFLAAAVLFLAFVSGYFLGQNSIAGSFTVETERMPDAEQTGISSSAAGENRAEAAKPAVVQGESGDAAKSGSPAEAEKININTADAALLETLPGIGAKKAMAIVEYREKNGYFRYTEQIVDVPGIGEGIFAEIEGLITVGEEGYR
jgi:competence protein ComEA